jgi:hypothetical protein
VTNQADVCAEGLRAMALELGDLGRCDGLSDEQRQVIGTYTVLLEAMEADFRRVFLANGGPESKEMLGNGSRMPQVGADPAGDTRIPLKVGM